jgi:uncharacterized protein (DUF433 family)
MSFSSINIQGNIISSEILDKIRSEDKFKFQTPEAFGLARTASLRDEIGMAWSIMRTHWQAYKKRLETLPQGDTGTSLTRERLIIPLLIELGYQVGLQRAQLINGKSYSISHGATNKDDFPIHIMGYNDNLDKRRETGNQKVSPHALVQEYLNNTEHLYALVTNGKQLRLLRDATRLVRMSYLEFDLERMFEEELYADFSLLFRVLHASRMPEKMEAGAESVFEYYHQESMASGTRIRTKLSEAVEDSIKTLANGFLSHPKNEDLLTLLEGNKLKAETYYTHQLRLIYRVLFLIVLEERKLVYPENLSHEEQRYRDIYYKYYSIERLRKLTENRVYVDADKYDLWESLKTTFLLFENQEYGNKIGIKPLGSGLFASNALGTLKKQFLSNGNLIEVLKRLTTFVNDQKQLVRVNYSDLDVEEFGSVYEGLLEYAPIIEKIGLQYHFAFIKGDDRSSSGSHYTPEELVKPLIKHSLDYIIADKLKETNPEEALLSITVCDVACGSGHILLSAARKIAAELASIREGAEQPSPAYYRAAIRDVIKNCIYGVDLNPLAVELCKVALWLEAHEPGQPMNFLDHHIKSGNAIVGLAHFEELEKGIASEAFKTLPGDEKEIAAAFKKRNDLERKTKGQLTTFDVANADNDLKDLQKEFSTFSQLPENTPEQIAKKEKAYHDLSAGKKWYRLKQLADMQVAQFFIPKTEPNKRKLITHAEYMTYLKTGSQIQDQAPAMASALSSQKHFFHWFLEFPAVFQKGGFDCILGNPPFLGNRKLSGTYGDAFLEFIKYQFAPIGAVDLVTYFFRRIFIIIKQGGFQSLISTNTIAQGNAREDGLDIIVKNGGAINHAVKSMKWPGQAAVEVALVTITKQKWNGNFILGGKAVNTINSYLDDEETIGTPNTLKQNIGKSFQGSITLGKGFVVEKITAEKLISDNTLNKDVLFPYLNGDNLNNNPKQNATRWVINFFDWTEEKARSYPDCYNILEQLVKPDRQRTEIDKNGNEIYVLRKPLPQKWWIYADKRPALYQSLSTLKRTLVIARTSKTGAFTFVSPKQVLNANLTIITIDDYVYFSFLQSTIHNLWAWKYSAKLKTDLIYQPSDVFENFPFPQKIGQNKKLELEKSGNKYHEDRRILMENIQLGLTKTYNLLHCNDVKWTKDKQVIALQKHLEKTTDTIDFDEAILGIIKLRKMHKEMDEAVLEAYGWQDIALHHDFYEVDYLPENDRVRYTIHPEARKEVLKRLLELNHKIHEEEVAAGLWDKKKPVKKEKKVIAKVTTIEEKEINQVSLFDIENNIGMKEFSLNEGIYSVIDAANIIKQPADKVRRWFKKLSEVDYEGLDGTAKTDIDKRRISFHGLIELVVIGTLLDNGFTIRNIVKARTDLKSKSGKDFYPFATNNVKDDLKVSGNTILFQFPHGTVTLDGTGQYNLDIIKQFFKDIIFENDIAMRIMPQTGKGEIIIDPKFAGGKPSFVKHNDLEVEMIMGFYDGEDSIAELMENYSLSREEIEAALNYCS